MRRRVIIHWGISSFFGWGVYGLNLASSWSRDPDVEPVCSFPIQADQIRVDPLRQLALQPFLNASADFQAAIEAGQGSRRSEPTPMLASVNGNFTLLRAVHDVALTGRPTLAATFFESEKLSPEAVTRASAFDRVITGSRWNEAVLRDHGLTQVETVLQGIDPTLFHPAPREGVLGDRFLVFSGGKLERRKGQDIVLAAFRTFAASRPDAMLATAWHSPWGEKAATLDGSDLTSPVIHDARGRIDVVSWAQANGLRPDQVLDLGAPPNALMPSLLREMDVAVFPNRCEGGTNLVAMECMACGVPAILSANSGHLDLIAPDNCYALEHQSPVADQPGWRDSDVDEVVAALERAYENRDEAARRGAAGARTLAQLPWSRTAAGVKAAVLACI